MIPDAPREAELPEPAGPSGFSLVEVAVALVLLAVGTLGILELARASSADARTADVGERLLWEVTRVADSVEHAGGGSGGYQTATGAQVRWEVAPAGGWVEGSLPGADSAFLRLPVVPLTGEVPVRSTIPGSSTIPGGGGVP